MERYTMLLDWKNQYCQNYSSTQGNLQIQCNPYQATKDILHQTRAKYLISVSYHCRLVETNLTSIREDAGSIPGLAHCVRDLALQEFPLWLSRNKSDWHPWRHRFNPWPHSWAKDPALLWAVGYVADMAQISRCCGCSIGQWLEVWFDH